MSLFGKHKHSGSQHPAGMKTLFRLTAFALAVCAVLSGCQTEVALESIVGSSPPTTAPDQTILPVTTLPQPTEIEPPETTSPKPTETEPTEPTLPEDFEIPEGIPGVVTYDLPLEAIPMDYMPEQAAADGCVVLIEGDADKNEDFWFAWTMAYSRGICAKVRFVDFYSTGQVKRLYELIGTGYGDNCFFYRWVEEGTVKEQLHRALYMDYIVKEDGENYLTYKLYALTSEDHSEWPPKEGIPTDDSTWNNNMVLIFCEFTTVMPHPEIPQPQKVTLTYKGETLGTLWNYDKLVQLREILANAEGYVGEPKPIIWGPELTITDTDGNEIIIRMMQHSPMVMIDEVFYLYDPGWKNAVHVEDVMELFGLNHPYPWEQ